MLWISFSVSTGFVASVATHYASADIPSYHGWLGVLSAYFDKECLLPCLRCIKERKQYGR